MVKIGLMVKANLKNVSRLYPHEPEQFCWPLKSLDYFHGHYQYTYIHFRPCRKLCLIDRHGHDVSDTVFYTAENVKCTGCGEEDQNWHLISQDEVVELSNAEAHFLYKCKCCSRENYMTIIPSNHVNGKSKSEHQKKNVDTVYCEDDDEKFKTIICFECRGLELTDFEPRDGWAVQSKGKVFVDVDLSEKEWYEYNDIDNIPVEITNIEHKFMTVK